MYKNSEEVLEKLKEGKVALSTVTRNMNKCIHRKDINQYLVFSKAKGLYLMWKREE